MKKMIFILLKYGMRFLYFFMKLLIPVRDKAVFLSRQSDTPSENFLLLRDELQRVSPSTKCEFYCRLGLKSEMGLSYALLMLRQMAALAGAKLCITESYCIPVSILHHKKQLRIVQIWHSLVAIKQFGWQTVDRPEGTASDIAEIMDMHKGYDFVAVGSEYMRPFFADAMHTPVEKILPLGTPVADRLLQSAGQHDELKRKFYETYPQAKGKKIAVWLPTMRRDYPIDCQGMIDGFDCETFALIVKLHPLDRHTVITGDTAIIDKKFTTEQAIILADAVISDYSGAAAEAALLDKPVYFFVPDTQRYNEECGINVNPLEVFPDVSFAEPRKLVDAVLGEKAADRDIALVKEKLCGGCDGHSTEKIIRAALALEASE
ncbi:MAG: CDP-glycerol glycerophosphotransferase family protein [Clostridia bacterium]|nr:CDP-glycerol glycerophosphotransferase family protein [Clostridia bacterium]